MFGRWSSALKTIEWMLLFFFYICMDETFYFHKDFMLDSSIFHIYTSTIFIGISPSVICLWNGNYQRYPSLGLIFMFNEVRPCILLFHGLDCFSRCFNEFKTLVYAFPHPWSGYALCFTSSIIWTSMPWAHWFAQGIGFTSSFALDEGALILLYP